MPNSVSISIVGENLAQVAISGVSSDLAALSSTAEGTTSTLAQTQDALSKVEAEGAKLTSTMRLNSVSVAEAKAALEGMKASLGDSGGQIGELVEQLSKLQGENTKVSLSIREVDGEIKSVSASVRDAPGTITPWTAAVQQLASVIPGLGEGLKVYSEAAHASAEATEAAAVASEAGATGIDAMAAAAPAAALGIAAIAVAVVALGAELTKVGGEWQHQMTSLGNAAEIPVEATNEIGAALAKLSTEVPTSMADLAKGLTSVAGEWELYTGETLDAASATELARSAAELATASGESYASALNALVTQQMAAGHGMEDLAQTQDVLYNVSRLTNVTMDQQSQIMSRLQQRMGEAAPGINDVGLALVLATNSGITGARAMQQVSQVMDGLTSGSEKTNSTLEELDITLEHNADGSTNTRKLFEDLQAVWENTDPADHQKIATDLVGQAHGTLERMLDKSIGKMDELEAAVDKQGSAMEAAERHAGDLTERVEELHNRQEAFATMIGSTLVPKVLEFGDDLNNLVLAGGKLNNWFQNDMPGAVRIAIDAIVPFVGVLDAIEHAYQAITGSGHAEAPLPTKDEHPMIPPEGTSGSNPDEQDQEAVRQAYVTAEERKKAAEEAARAEKEADAEAKREEKQAAAEAERERKAAVAEAEREMKQHQAEQLKMQQELVAAQEKYDADMLAGQEKYEQSAAAADASYADSKESAMQAESEREYDIWAQGEVKKLDDAEKNALKEQETAARNAQELARIDEERHREDDDRAEQAARSKIDREEAANRRIEDIRSNAAQSSADAERHYDQSRQEAAIEHQTRVADIQKKGGPGMGAALASENQSYAESSAKAAREEQASAADRQAKAAEQVAAAQKQAAEQQADADKKSKESAAELEKTRGRQDADRKKQQDDAAALATMQEKDQTQLAADKLTAEQAYHVDAESKATIRHENELARIDAKYAHDLEKGTETLDLLAAKAAHDKNISDIKATGGGEDAIGAENARYTQEQGRITSEGQAASRAIDVGLRDKLGANAQANQMAPTVHNSITGNTFIGSDPGTAQALWNLLNSNTRAAQEYLRGLTAGGVPTR